MAEGSGVYDGACSRCRRTITAEVTFRAEGGRGPVSGLPVSPSPIIGAYCECGDKDAPGGLSSQAVPLTLRGDPA